MLIAGDIGGTKTILALFDDKKDVNSFSNLSKYSSKNYPNLKSIIEEYLSSLKERADIHTACFAIAGPIQDGICKATNLPWIIDAADLSETLKIPHVYLLNDLEANAYAIEILNQDARLELYPGKKRKKGNMAVISPGTGLGEAAIYWDGKRHLPFACEGGHCEFGPRNEVEIDLCRYLYQRYGHSSYERVLSGPGLLNIYQFFQEVLERKEVSGIAEEMTKRDPAAVISENALNKKSDLCVDTLNLFVSILGSEAGNCVLKFMATGGLYIGGGIAPKILPKLQDSTFFEAFADKGRLRPILEETPIHVILDDRASLKGAAHFCQLKESLFSKH